jgi:hypothetical protein
MRETPVSLISQPSSSDESDNRTHKEDTGSPKFVDDEGGSKRREFITGDSATLPPSLRRGVFTGDSVTDNWLRSFVRKLSWQPSHVLRQACTVSHAPPDRYAESFSMLLCWLQTELPQFRQWWRRRNKLNGALHLTHELLFFHGTLGVSVSLATDRLSDPP